LNNAQVARCGQAGRDSCIFAPPAYQARAPIGSRIYDTSSSAWEGTASSMTRKPGQAIAKPMISDIKHAKAR